MSLRQKLLEGSIWNAVSQFGTQGINFVVILILGRLLSPQEFGMIGMITVFVGFLGYFSEFGLSASIVKKEDCDELDLHTVFWSGIAFSVLLYAVIFVAAPLISMFYKIPKLTILTQVLFIGFPLRALAFVPNATESKALRYDRVSKANLIAVAISSSCAIGCAFAGLSVWSLVVQSLSYDFFTVVFIYVFVRFKPRAQFSFARFKMLIAFGAHVTLNNLIKFMTENIDVLLVGKMVGAKPLGVYSFAYRLSRYPIEKLLAIFGRMLFPAFSLFQNDARKSIANNRKINISCGIIAIPFALGFYFGAMPIVNILLGTKWIDAIPLIKIFLFYVMFYSLSIGDEPLLMASGYIKQVNVVKFISAFLIACCGAVLLFLFGVQGIAWAVSIMTILQLIVLKALVCKAFSVPYHEYIRGYSFLTLVTGGISVVLYLYSALVPRTANYFVYLLGEASLVAVVMGSFLVCKGVFQLKRRRFVLDALF